MRVFILKVIHEKIMASMEITLPKLTQRNIKLPQIAGKLSVMLGMRNTGKTAFLHQRRADRLAEGKSPQRQVYFNFEDERLSGISAADLHHIPDTIYKLFPLPENEALTLYLDEIQLVPGWEALIDKWIDTEDVEIYLSGSSATLLSSEVKALTRDLVKALYMHPFHFSEYLDHHGLPIPENGNDLTNRQRFTLDHHFMNFLKTGGFPKAQCLDSEQRRLLMQDEVNLVLLRDVIELHEIRNPKALRWLVRRLLSNPAGFFSITKLYHEIKSEGISISREHLYDYLDHLEDTFLLHTVPVATDSEKRRQVNPRKVYPADPSLISVFNGSSEANTANALESAVFIELKRRNAEVAYVKTKQGNRLNFLAVYNDYTQVLIQVCTSVDNAKTLAREIQALEQAKVEFPRATLLILTAESRMPYPDHPDSMTIMPAWLWMLLS